MIEIKRSIHSTVFKSVVPLVLAALVSGGRLVALPPGVGPLTFSDEFGGTTLDATKWIHRAPGPRNDGFNTQNAVSVGGGLLTIKTYSEAGTNFTGMIATQTRFEQTYGYFEARARFHTTSGQWGAFWLQSPTIGFPVGDPEHAGVEMDIFEHRARDPFDGLVDPKADTADRSHQALVWNGYGRDSKSKANLTPPLPGLANDTWHTFGLSWGTNGYGFYYDDHLVWSETSPVSRRSQYIILSSEVWHAFAGPIPPGGYGSLATSTTDMQIDYIRVYQNPAAIALGITPQPQTPRPQVRVVENGEAKAKPEGCRGIIVGPGINQPDPFPGYGGFVGWESPIRLQNGDWLVDSRHA
jgi:beta-glucanase (GH16 family)